ncbi:MAG: PucR family transcriptional regulator ligand-binding domain-containing protein [Christensenella sp.]|nr:PucR family transcriptional regulator ligand-binding domain-containing protein [Christensenella sp.]
MYDETIIIPPGIPAKSTGRSRTAPRYENTMGVTVKQCLALPCLSEAQVVGGASGLNRIVRRASVLEIATLDDLLVDASSRGNDVVISALFSVAESVEQQCKTLRVLNQGGEACLILFYAGTVVKEISPELIHTADDLDFPLIVMPDNMEVTYADLIFDITSLLLSDQSTASININEIIYAISQNNVSDLSRAMKIISEKFGGGLILTNSFYDPLLVTCAQKDEGSIGPDVWAEIVKDLKRKNAASAGSGCFFQYQKDGKNFNAFFTNLWNSNGFIHLLVIDFSNSMNYTDISSVASVVGICAGIWKYCGNTDENNLVQAVLSNNTVQTQFALAKYCLKPGDICNLIVLSGGDGENELMEKDKEIRRALEHSRLDYFSAAKDSSIIYIPYKSASASLSFAPLLKNLENMMKQDDCENLLLLFALNLNGPEGMSEIYTFFCEIHSMLQIAFPTQRVFDPYTLEFIYTCVDILKNDKRRQRLYTDFLTPLEAQHSDALVDTLAVFMLDANRSVHATAQLMYVHINTVQYRLKKAKELLNIDLTNISETIFLVYSLAIRRIMQSL